MRATISHSQNQTYPQRRPETFFRCRITVTMKCVITLLVLFVVGCQGFSSGPPVLRDSSLCNTIMPKHGANASTEPSPFEILVPSPCYKEGLDIPVFVKVKAGEQTYKYFEGLFILARNASEDLSTSFGTFTTTDDQLQLLPCHDRNGSAIGHNQKKHWTCKKFNWRAPDSFQETIKFHGTVVKNQETFWVGLGSVDLAYGATCAQDATALNQNCDIKGTGHDDKSTQPPPGPNPSGSQGLTGYMMPLAMALLFAALTQFVLQ